MGEELRLPFAFYGLIPELNAILDQNFGGRRLLLLQHHEVVNEKRVILPGLWPLVLGRINSEDLPTQSIPIRDNQDSDPELKSQIRRANIMHYMLRENTALQ